MYDYILCNDNLEDAFKQLVSIAQRALAGQIGSGTGPVPTTLVQDTSGKVGPRQHQQPLHFVC